MKFISNGLLIGVNIIRTRIKLVIDSIDACNQYGLLLPFNSSHIDFPCKFWSYFQLYFGHINISANYGIAFSSKQKYAHVILQGPGSMISLNSSPMGFCDYYCPPEGCLRIFSVATIINNIIFMSIFYIIAIYNLVKMRSQVFRN